MIIVTRSEQEGASTLLVRGHAGYAAPGRDIVCAGVSALVFAYLSYLEGLTAPDRSAVGGENESATATSDGQVPLSQDASGAEKPADDTSSAPCVRRRLGNGMLEVTSRGIPEEQNAWALVRTGIALLAEAYPNHVRLHGPSVGVADDTIINTMRKEPKHEKAKRKSVSSRRGRGKTR